VPVLNPQSGTVFWSEDSKRVFLRDEYAADDTKIRVFDVAGPGPNEIKGLDGKIRTEISAHIPANERPFGPSIPKPVSQPAILPEVL
jgi:hypothetical protein